MKINGYDGRKMVKLYRENQTTFYQCRKLRVALRLFGLEMTQRIRRIFEVNNPKILIALLVVLFVFVLLVDFFVMRR